MIGGGRRWAGGLMLAGVLLHLVAAAMAARYQATVREGRAARRLAAWLQEYSRQVKPEAVLQRLALDLTRGCLGQPLDTARAFLASAPARLGWPADAWEAILFDARGQAWLDEPLAKAGAETAFHLFRAHPLSAGPLPRGAEARTIRFLGGGVGFGPLRGRPRRLVRLSGASRRTWAFWDFAHQPAPSLVAGVLLLFHEARLTEDRLARWQLDHDRIPRTRVGFLDRDRPSRSRLPPPLRPATAAPLLRQAFLAGQGDRLRLEGRLVVFAPEGERLALIGLLDPPRPVLPRWLLGLLFLWLPWAIRLTWTADRFRLTLPDLLAGLVLIAAALPLTITFLFWSWFEDNRRAASLSAACTALENRLVAIDSQFPTLLRRRRHLYRRDFRLVQEDRRRLPEFLRRLEAHELAGRFDTAIVVSSAGVLLRPFTNSANALRRLALRPPAQRQAWLQAFFEAGLNPRPEEVDFIKTWRFDGTNTAEFIGLIRAEDARTLHQIAAQVARDFVRAYDQQRGLASPEAETDVTSMVVGSILEEGGRNPVQLFAAHFGDFVTLGSGRTHTTTFLDIIPGADGRGAWCGMLFHQMPTLEQAFLNEVFRDPGRWPPGQRLYAVSSDALLPHYPRLRSNRLFPPITDRLVLPRRLWSGLVRRGGRRYLLAAMLCPHLPHTTLIAVQPVEQALADLADLRSRLVAGGGLLLALAILLVWRLVIGVQRPAATLMAGGRAMAARQHQHRIALPTGDEWETLAGAFNQALASLEELEVARLVQTRLLPSGPITAGAWSFMGNSLMTSEVGGDYFDGWARDDGRLVFLVGDVSGHSVSAALVVAMAKAAFSVMVREGDGNPAALLSALNDVLLAHLRKVKMMTCFVGCAHPDGTLEFANAGQAYPYLLEPGCAIRPLELVGFPLGTFRKGVFPRKTVPMAPGARLIMFTDGLVEAVSPAGEPFSYPRLEATLTATRSLPAPAVFAAVAAQVQAFTQAETWADDVTLALLERAPHLHATMPTGMGPMPGPGDNDPTLEES